MIRKAVKNNLLFDDLDPDDLSHLIDAFERIEVAKGQKIVTQGDRGYFFFIVGKDSSVTFHLNGIQTGKAMEGGSFGELALMYSCRRAATVIATTPPTVLFRVDRKTFKSLLRKQTDSREAQKIDLLKGVDFLSEISERDLNRLARAMTLNIFKCDDVIVKKGDEGDAFYIVNEGILEIQNISVGSQRFRNVTLESGEYFGERALITNEPRAAHVIADTKGSVFRIERKIFERILGKFGRVIMKAQDRKILEGMDAFESSHLTKSQFEELANLVVDKKFEPKEKIFTHRKRTNAALYIIREGTIRLKGGRSDLIKPGAYFGEDLLLLDTRQEVEKSKRASTKTPAGYTAIAEEECLCGILSLSECRTIFDTSEMLNVKLEVDLRALGEEFKSEEFTNEEELIECSLGPRINCRRTSTEWLEKESKNGLRHAVERNVTFEDLKRHDKLGEGQFGEVFLASAYVSSEYDKQVFALKTQKKVDPMRGDSTDLIKREIELLSCMDHPYIVNLIHYYEYSEEIYILMGAVYGGELFDVIHSENTDGTWSSGIPEKDARFYAMVLADTLDYIHRKQLVHRDLKPENVLIDEDGYPIICDFGFGRFYWYAVKN